MSHLTHDQLSALLDQRLGLGERGVAERHLQECRACRDAYHDLEAQDRRLERGLAHDPGDSYFSSFADVVQTRIEAEGVNARRGVPGAAGWFDRPMNLAFAGVAAAVVLGLGAALLASRHTEKSPLVNDKLESRTQQVNNTPAATPAATPAEDNTAEPAPVLGLTEEAAKQAKQFREDKKKEGDAAGGAAAQKSTNAYETTHNSATGEDERASATHMAPAAAAAPSAAGSVDLKRAQTAQPMAKDQVGVQEEVVTRRQTPSAADADARFCGNVHDANGRALRFASITLLHRNAGVQSDDRGRFCLYTSPGTDSMLVTLLGFKPLRRVVHISADAPDLNVQLEAVPTLSKSAVSLRTLESPAMKSSGAPSVTPEEQIAALPDSLRQVADLAVRYSDVATRSRDAHQHDAAAAQWERLLRHVEGSPLEVHTRGRIAEERYRAWEAEPNDHRAQDAREALTAFLVRAPQGAERNRDALWLDEVAK